jgi:hypothetical protein
MLARLLNVVCDNGGDTMAAVKQLFQLVTGAVGYEKMLQSNYTRFSDKSVQLGVVNVQTLIQHTNEQLRQAPVGIRRSKVMRQEYRRAAEAAGLSSKEPTYPDSPTRAEFYARDGCQRYYQALCPRLDHGAVQGRYRLRRSF